MLATTVDRTAALDELKKFFALSVELDAPLTMFSDFVDEAWHELMSNPEEYEAFCKEACGRTLGHTPSGDTNPIVVVEWVADYEKRHGDLPAVWFADKDGVFQEDAYKDYIDSHTIVAAWKCSPSSGSIARPA